jgi:hypothetical protein
MKADALRRLRKEALEDAGKVETPFTIGVLDSLLRDAIRELEVWEGCPKDERPRPVMKPYTNLGYGNVIQFPKRDPEAAA